MKPSARKSLPTAIILFGLAVTGMCLLESGLMDIKMNSRARRFHYTSTFIASDGAVTYNAWRVDDPHNPEAAYYEFDESLKSSHKLPSFRKTTDPVIVTYTLPNLKRPIVNSENLSYKKPEDVTIDDPVAWWNRKEGQVDLYSRVTRLRIGSLGQDGTIVPAPGRPVGRFEYIATTGGQPHSYFAGDANSVYHLQLPNGPVRKVYEGQIDNLAFRTVSLKDLFFVQSGNTLTEFDADGQVVRSVTLPPVLQGRTYQATFRENGQILFQASAGTNRHVRLTILADSNGRVLREVTVSGKDMNTKMNGGVPNSQQIPFPTVMPPIPVLMTTPALIQSIVLSLILAGWVAWRETRRGSRGGRRIAWMVLTFLSGIAGVAAYHTVYWDVRTEKCPGCERLRPVTEELCPHCSAPWPPPPRTGIEIIEPA